MNHQLDLLEVAQGQKRPKIVYLDDKEAVEFLLPRHYSGRKPSISYAFGLEIGEEIKAVCTFGKPVSDHLCREICGEEYKDRVFELNRLCKDDDVTTPMSYFVSACLRRISTMNLIIVSYSDMGMNHHGYVYQATNFYYTGITKERTDKFTPGNKHSRHYKNEEQNGLRKLRTPKHRYVFFAMYDKRLKKECKKKLKYPILPYPKGDNSNYVLGEYQEPIIVEEKL